jgi:hypothetical protein
MKKRKLIWYPVLIAAYPVLGVFSANLSLCPISDIWRPLAVATGVGAIIWAICSLLFRNIAKGAAAATVIIICLYCFGAWQHAFLYKTVSPLPMYFFAAMGLVIAFFAGRKWPWHGLLNVLSLFLIVVNVGAIGFGYMGIARDRAKMASAVTVSGTKSSTPDIYYIILDAYGRSDQLKRVMGFDDKPFIDGLQSRGFYVASDCHSNYVQTELSVASSMNMGFLQDLMPAQERSSDDRVPLSDLVDNNAIARFLKQFDYEYIVITSGFSGFWFTHPDLHLGGKHEVSLLESALLDMTPINVAPGGFGDATTRRRDDINGAFDNLRTVAGETSPRPRFIFVHILAPHPSFVFMADGSRPPWKHNGGIWDGSDYMEHVGPASEYVKGYLGQLQYVNTQMTATIDTILRQPGLKPIILIQGDHGSKLRLDQNVLAKTDIGEAMSNLMAYYVPDDVKKDLYPSITPVNSFRIVLSDMFAAKLPRLPDDSWYSGYNKPYEFYDVTKPLKKYDH